MKMTTLKFKIRLLSDVIINQKAATEGPNKTLDFIPGSNFLGIAASTLYKEMDEETLYIFHSGHVRFGDAHPAHGGARCHKVPTAMFHPKLKKASEMLFISHAIPETAEVQEQMRKEQLKQCRSGFYDFSTTMAEPANTGTSFAIKSAYDIKKRTSKEGQMYGYESLDKNTEMYFAIEMDDDKYVEKIKAAMIGKKRIGRSRSAQYGLVEISEENYTEVGTEQKTGEVTVYADSRLIFLDKNTGMPTFRPAAKDLGLKTGKINWDKSQIRTFQYAPWNYVRKCFDTDRCGIEKGSVIVVEEVEACPEESAYVGCYRNEGFGRVIYNPAFLEAGDKGEAKYKLQVAIEGKRNEPADTATHTTPLLAYLLARKKEEENIKKVYDYVETWVEDKNVQNLFSTHKDAFASQWGSIRRIATQFHTAREINNELFEKKMIDQNGKEKPNAYLTHGVASDKWKGDRLKAFKEFCKRIELEDRYYRMVIINLAAEMGKS